jgi:hypothetical protein
MMTRRPELEAANGGFDDVRAPAAVGGRGAEEREHLAGFAEIPVSASPARVYDYWLGGKDHLGVDRQVGDAVAQRLPWIVPTVKANRRFLVRAVGYLAGELGVDQFVDIGSGLPTARNVHEVAQQARSGARTVYVDHDSVVLAHARALLACDRNTAVVEGDAREPGSIVGHPALSALVDWSRPVAVLMVAVLHFLTDEDDPAATIAAFHNVMAPGSYLVISHAAPGPASQAQAMREAVALYEQMAAPITVRAPDQVMALMTGFDLVEPGLAPVDAWYPPGHRRPSRRTSLGGQGVAGVGRRGDVLAPPGPGCAGDIEGPGPAQEPG